MPEKPPEDHYASAALRHFADATFLHDDGRLPNADHHYGFAAECASKSLMMRFTDVSMDAKREGGKLPNRPWFRDPVTGDIHNLGHINELIGLLPVLARGRSGARLVAALNVLAVFDSWKAEDRYTDGTTVVDSVVLSRRQVSRDVLSLHEQATLNGRLP